MTSSTLSYYKGKKVFITGHTGFKGAWLMAVLYKSEAIVKGYALAPEYPGGLFDVIQPVIRVESVIADIRDREKLADEILAFQPDFIFHLAAQPLVRRSYNIPAETFDINVTGTANLLEAVTRLAGKTNVVVITTDKVYENREQDVLYHEDDRLGGYDPYSASKACAEITVAAFRSSFFNPLQFNRHKKAIATARAGNVIGGGDWSADRIIPDIIRSLDADQPVDVRNPSAVRPWQHVFEPLSGYLKLGMLMDKDPSAFAGAYNFGPVPEDHLRVDELVQLATEYWGSGSWKDISGGNQPHEAGLLKLDISKAIRELEWSPKLNAKDAISWTIDWYKCAKENRAEFSLDQVNRYFSK